MRIQKIATAKAVPEKELRQLAELVPTGVTEVDTTVRIRGTLKKGEPFTQRIAAAADPWRLLAVALGKLNTASLDAIVREAIESPDSESEVTKARVTEAIGKIVAATEREMPGRLTAQLVWELLA